MGRGVGVRHLDHVNLLAVDPGENRDFCERYLGLRLTEQIVLDDGSEAGVWLASSQKSYDLTYTRDVTGTRGRLHHIAFFVDQREDVLRAADIFLEHGIVMESGPHKHAIQQTFFLYTYEPGGNRIEVCAGGFLIFDPAHEPVVWSQAERAKGQAWGMQTVASFHIKGTPPVPEEDVLLARSAGH
jgi:catechol 2,3-dioxygenase